METAFQHVITETEDDAKFANLVLLCESSLKQDSFRNHVDRVFENYIFSRDSKVNMATKAILYNCMVCEDDFEYDFKNKTWIRTTNDRYAFNEAMRKFNKIIYHDKRFRGRIPWVVKNVKEYFKMKLVKKYYSTTSGKPQDPTSTKKPIQPQTVDKRNSNQPAKPQGSDNGSEREGAQKETAEQKAQPPAQT